MSNRPSEQNKTVSTHTPLIAGNKPATLSSVAAPSNVLTISGDMGIWDTVSNKFVLVDQTSVGTTALPKL